LSSDKKRTFRQQGKKQQETKIGIIPMLRYGKGNNLCKLKTVLAEVALKEYGNLGKLIEVEKYRTMYLHSAYLPMM
jgi:hypothetical protein